MLQTIKPIRTNRPPFDDKIVVIRKKLARAIVGSTVDLLADRQTVAHGIVTGVFMTAGTPKIIVNGETYDMNQVLTSTAASIH
jgi:nitrous oxidase accessory protein NosD